MVAIEWNMCGMDFAKFIEFILFSHNSNNFHIINVQSQKLSTNFSFMHLCQCAIQTVHPFCIKLIGFKKVLFCVFGQRGHYYNWHNFSGIPGNAIRCFSFVCLFICLLVTLLIRQYFVIHTILLENEVLQNKYRKVHYISTE